MNMSTNKIMRLNDIELRMSRYAPNSNPRFEIVRWEVNNLYGKECDYEKIGEYSYRKKFDTDLKYHYNWYYDNSCFQNKETCYSIAIIENGIVNFIGNRAIDLNNEQAYKDFLFLLRKGVSKSIKWKNK